MSRSLGFRGPLAAQLVGVSYRRLDYWAHIDLVRPSIAQGRGSGTTRVYSSEDLVRLRIIGCLLGGGISFPAARRASGDLCRRLAGSLVEISLILKGSQVVVARSDGEVLELLHREHGVLNVLPLGPLAAELDRKIRDAVARNASGVVPLPETIEVGYSEQALPFAG
jgi:DNA-binding transcriptional MerR regulator